MSEHALKCGKEMARSGAAQLPISFLKLPPSPPRCAQVVRVLALLQLMAAVHQASRGRYLWGAGAGSVEAALRALGEALRQESRAATLGAEAGQQGAGDGAAGERQQLPLGEQAEEAALAASEAAEVAKLAWSAEEQAAALAARRAGQLAPACLKLVKDLLQRQGGAGAGKHD